MTALTPEQRAEAVESLRAHIVVDATGLAPAVIGHYVTGFDAALDAAYPIIRKAVLEEAAWAAKQWWHKPECERPDIAIRALGDEA